jgi:hypothetical protein
MSSLFVPRLRAVAAAALLVGLSARAAQGDAPKAKNPPAAAPATAEPAVESDVPSGDGLSKWKVDDADPVKSVPTNKERDSDPLQFGYHLMDLAEKGGVAAKKGDHRAAVKYFAALAKAVPDRSVSFSRLCTSYEALGDWEKAVQACRTALGLEGVTVADSSHFVRLMLAKRSALTPAELDDVVAVVAHLRADEATSALATDLDCEIGLRLEDVKRLDACASALATTAPDQPRTISYQWALALAQKNFGAARAAIERAKASAIPVEGLHRMEEATVRAEPLWRKVARDWRVISAGATLVGAALIALRMRRRSAVVVGS